MQLSDMLIQKKHYFERSLTNGIIQFKILHMQTLSITYIHKNLI